LWTRPWFEHQNMRDERVEARPATFGRGKTDRVVVE
jgi:hypothetical protein